MTAFIDRCGIDAIVGEGGLRVRERGRRLDRSYELGVGGMSNIKVDGRRVRRPPYRLPTCHSCLPHERASLDAWTRGMFMLRMHCTAAAGTRRNGSIAHRSTELAQSGWSSHGSLSSLFADVH